MAADLIFIGLQAMIDPPRPEAILAVDAFKRAGVKVKMITGDHAVTAAAIGVQLGLGISTCPGQPTCQVMTGSDMALLSDDELTRRASETAVFARVAPDQKLRLVMALQGRGEIVAMTGDGVNDAPALKQADIGVAMGKGGTEAAKEAADMILTDDISPPSRPPWKKGAACTTTSSSSSSGHADQRRRRPGHPPGHPPRRGPAILPVQILWINMTTAGCLGLMLAFEPKDPVKPFTPPSLSFPSHTTPAKQRTSPRLHPHHRFIGLYEWELQTTGVQEQARTVAVNVFVMVEAFYLFNSRSFTRSAFELGFWTNPWVTAGFVIMVVLQLAFTYVPFMNTLFGSAPIGILPWVKIIAASLVAYLIIEAEKKIRNRQAAA